MTSTLVTPSSTATSTRRPVWRAAALSGVLAAAATATMAVVGTAAGVSLDIDGEPIPAAGFVTMTLMAVVVGYALAIALSRWASRPRRTFTVSTIVMTVASFIPDLTFPMATGTRVLLIATHIVAAAIVIPAIAARLDEQR